MMPRDLRLLSGAVALSAAGDLLLVVVLSLHVHDLTGSGFAVAALFAALMAPIVVLAPVAGRLVDRIETRRLLLVVSLAQAVVATGLVFVDGLARILMLAALLGAGAAVAGPAEAALVPATVAEDQLTRANGWVETARYSGFTAGPLLAGVLIAAGGTGSASPPTPRASSPSRSALPFAPAAARRRRFLRASGGGLRPAAERPHPARRARRRRRRAAVHLGLDDRRGLLRARRRGRRRHRLRARVRRLDGGNGRSARSASPRA